MKSSAAPRRYQQRARASAAEATLRAAMDAAVSLWRERDFEEITMEQIAERAGVSVQTLFRRFGSKLGLLERCLEEGGTDAVRALRNQAPEGDVAGALQVLMAHYERDGAAVIRTLRLEGRSEAADRIVARGRIEHRAWCARVFAPYLPDADGALYERALDAFVAATDIYVWQLLRRDLGRSEVEVLASWSYLVGALVSRAAERREER